MSLGRAFVVVLVAAIVADVCHNMGWLPFLTSDGVDDSAAGGTPELHLASDEAAQDFCVCSQDDVEANSAEVLRLLNRIVQRPYFKYFKVNTQKECPFWAVNLLCTSSDSPCTLCACNAEDIPVEVRNEPGDMSDVGDVTMGTTPSTIESWGHQQHTEGDKGSSVHASSLQDDGAEWVDLTANPEGNTGYTGPMANRVWDAIYRENCLKNLSAELNVPDAQQCHEFQVFFRLMSGFHSSIGINVAVNFHRTTTTAGNTAGSVEPSESERLFSVDSEGTESETAGRARRNPPAYLPNCDMLNRLRSFADRRANLNFLYQFVLRAVTKAAPLLLPAPSRSSTSTYHSGNPAEDDALVEDLNNLFSSRLLCSATFDETRFLQSPYAKELVPQMKSMMRNISQLMDCVGCQKCRLWGKLETQGIATALKIITASQTAAVGRATDMDDSAAADCASPVHDGRKGSEPQNLLELKRGEKIALVNLLRQLSVAVHALKHACV